MVGEPLESVREVLHTIGKDLKADPYALESVRLSVTVYAGRTQILVPPTSPADFKPPALPVGGGSRLGEALRHLADEIERQTIETDAPANWKPMVFVLTDAISSDDVASALTQWRERPAGKSEMIVVLFGSGERASVFRTVTDRIYRFDRTDPGAYKNLFRWISKSLRNLSGDQPQSIEVHALPPATIVAPYAQSPEP
ncbi:MAG: hypothetical protein RMM53_11640, partial [Bacteroidia bacterium]|nr:hypothetical protein [Bacteroidia bacterium]MDW8334859.1 hypothetical protein [Bacteroidia bacterium]